jgi:hypothetical protein
VSATAGVVAGMVVGGLSVAIVALFLGGSSGCARRRPAHEPLTVGDLEAEPDGRERLHPGKSATTLLPNRR